MIRNHQDKSTIGAERRLHMTATEILKHEHEIILMVLDAAEREIESIQGTGQVHRQNIEKMLDFFRSFADHCHHAKEEKHLFVKMKEKGMPDNSGPIFVMLTEHNQGRSRLNAIAEVLGTASEGSASAIQTVIDNLSGYVELLRNHILKEDNILFPAADKMFTPEDQKELMVSFEKVEAEEIGVGIHEKYHQIAHDLAKK